jgi:beta-lactamase regulating signal transducer with metallopeptidase domain
MSALHLLSGPWAERFGWTIVHFLWQGVLAAALYAGLRARMEHSSPNARYLLACATLTIMMVLPAVTFTLTSSAPAVSLNIRPANAVPQSAVAIEATGGSALESSFARIRTSQILPAVVLVWMLGAFVFWLRLAGGWIVAARLRSRQVRPVPAEWHTRFSKLATRIGLTRPIRLAVSAVVQIPTVVGWLRPMVLMPVGALAGLPAEHVEALLLHELAHVRRHDYLVNMFQGIAEALLFYHPAVWWVSGHIRNERELCCDDIAVRTTGDALTYVRALTELESSRPARLQTAMAADGGSLSFRIARLLGRTPPVSRTVSGPQVLIHALFIGIVVLAAAFTTQAQTPTNARAIDNLNKGRRAFEETRYESATTYFQEALRLAPNLTEAELYLGRSYARRFVPESKSRDNQDYADNAVRIFEDVLKNHPDNTGALAALADISFTRTQVGKAHESYVRLAQLEPLQPVWFYALGVTDWILAFDKEQPLPADEKARTIDEGLRNIDVALALAPDYANAMTYKNLLLREEAMLAQEGADRNKLIAEADHWFDEALRTRRNNANKPVTGGPALTDIPPSLVAPPPPPPPPPPGER